jgi:hypothetical protein
VFSDSGDNLTTTTTNYSDLSCVTQSSVFTKKLNTLILGSKTNTSQNQIVYRFTAVVTDITLEPKTSYVTTSLNNSSFCGLTSWSTGTETSISGLTCGSITYNDVNDNYFDIIQMNSEKTFIRLGDITNVASTGYPKTLNTQKYYKFGFTISSIIGNTTEDGGTSTFSAKLNSQPSADVSIDVSSSDTTEGTVSPSILTFSSTNYNTTQTVTVTGVNDSLIDDNQSYMIVLSSATSNDSNYSGIDPSNVTVINNDNDYVTTNTVVIDSLEWYDAAQKYNWANAVSYCSNLSLNSNSDWWLPTSNELGGIRSVSELRYNAYIWSSTTLSNATNRAYCLYFGSIPKITLFGYKTDSYYVRCVRSIIN